MAWSTEGVKNIPATGTVLADTGPMATGVYIIPAYWVSSSSILNYIFQHRNATNDGNINSHAFILPAGGYVLSPALGSVELAEGERFRIVTNGVTAGSAQATIFQ